MQPAITFYGDDAPRDAIYFQAGIIQANGPKGYVDISQEQYFGDIPINLSYQEALERGIDVSKLQENPSQPAITFDIPPEESTGSSEANFPKGVYTADGQTPNEPEKNIPFQPGTPALKTLPPEPLSPPQIHSTALEDRQKFRKAASNDKKQKERLTSVKILSFLMSHYIIHIYNNDIYIFNGQSGIYEYYTDEDLDFLINKHFGEEIKLQEDIYLYIGTKEYLKRESKLIVQGDQALPLNFWPFRNGFLNINTGELISNDGDYFVLNVLQCDYRPDAQCPAFDRFIYSIAGGDPNLMKLLWQTIGYLLSADTNGKVFFSFIGKKDTGKSLLARVLTKIIGEEAVSHLSASDLSGKFDVSNLYKKHLNVCMDLPNKKLSEQTVAKIKMLTGGDTVYADVKYKQPIAFAATARLLFGCNSMINTESPDYAFNERHIIIPFICPVPKEKQDFQLEEKLLLEASGICRKAIGYYKELVENSYQFVKVEYSFDSSEDFDYPEIIKAFAERHCVFTGNVKDKVSSSQLYSLFKDFCCSLLIPPLDISAFSRQFRESFNDEVEKVRARIGSDNVQAFTKLRLTSHAES